MTEYYNYPESHWRISQCCQFYKPKLVKQFNFGTTTKTYALKQGGKEKVQKKALENCDKLYKIITEYFAYQPINLRSFRISTTAFPCYTLDFTQPWYDEIRDEIKRKLKYAGEAARKHKVRLSVHPGQYTVLASNKRNVVENSIADLEYHALLGQYMGLEPESFTINIHLQGLYGGKHSDGIARFASHFGELSEYTQRALAVENEDKPNGYDISHVLELCSIIPTRATLDIHHYECYRRKQEPAITVNDEWFKEAVKTWNGIRPLFHVSQTLQEHGKDVSRMNQHSEVLHDEERLACMFPMLDYADFDIEAKNKEQAVNLAYKFFIEEQDFSEEIHPDKYKELI